MIVWNYRIGTKKGEDERLFSIIEVYYERDRPVSYKETNPLSDWNNVDDLRGTYVLIKHAFAKPVLDLDNWPKEFTE